MLQLPDSKRLLHGHAVCLLVLGTVVLISGDSTLAEETLTSKKQAPAVTAAEVSRWVSELDDNQFIKRERAQAKLEQAGLSAIEAVAEAAEDGTLERSTRALNILLSWSENTDRAQLRIAALEKIVGLRDRPKESRLAGEILADLREAIALAKISELGGSYTQDVRSRLAVVNLNGVLKPPLQVIIDSHWKGGTAGLEHLKDVRRMVTLSFHSMPLDPDEIGIVHRLPQLRWVELYGEGYTTETFSYLIPTAPPGLEFDVRKSALLGVRGDTNRGNAMVARVEPESAAAKAGIKQGDILMEMEEVKITNFEHLTRQISQYEAGHSVSLIVARPVTGQPVPKEIELTVSFDRWGEKPRDEADTPVHLQVESVLKPRGINLDRR